MTMLPGDGIGPEMMNYVKEVYRYAGAPVDFEEIRMDPNSEVDFYNAITSIKRNGVGLKGRALIQVSIQHILNRLGKTISRVLIKIKSSKWKERVPPVNAYQQLLLYVKDWVH